MLTFFTILFFASTGFAQTALVKGRVVDSNSSDVIVDVAISIKASTFNTVTDPEGLFVIQSDALPQGEQVLIISKAWLLHTKNPTHHTKWRDIKPKHHFT